MKIKSKTLILLSSLLLSGCTSTNSSSGEISSSYVPQEHEMVELRSLLTSDIEEGIKHEADSLNTCLYKGENVWLKYTATFDSVYCFTITTFSYGYHFSAAWDKDGPIIAEFDVNEENGNKVTSEVSTRYYGFYDIYLQKDKTIFLNICNASIERMKLAGYDVALTTSEGAVIQILPEGIERHTHTYGFSFEQYDDKQHKSFCWKDQEYVLEDHHFDTEGICSDCGYKK